MIWVSRHAEHRLQERCGINKKSVQRIAERAFTDGIQHADTKGNLHKWVDSLFFKNRTANNIRLYGDKAFIFAGYNLVTVIQIPANLRNGLKALTR